MDGGTQKVGNTHYYWTANGRDGNEMPSIEIADGEIRDQVGKGPGSRGRERNALGIPVPVPTRSRLNRIFPTRHLPSGPLEISVYVVFFYGVAEGCTLSPNPLTAFINDIIVAFDAAKQGVTMGEDTASGLLFANDFGWISVVDPDEGQRAYPLS